MNILEKTPIILRPVGDRHYALHEPVHFKIHFGDHGQFEFDANRECCIDFRSGGPLVDFFIDQMGENENIQFAYIMHDMFYTAGPNGKHAVSRAFADDRLYDVLIYGGMPKWKAWLVHKAVRLFGRQAYEQEDIWSTYNKYNFTIKWEP